MANEAQAQADEAPPYDFNAGGLVPDTSLDLDFSALLNEAHVVGGYSGDNGNTDTLVLHFTQSQLDALDVDDDADPIQASIASWASVDG